MTILIKKRFFLIAATLLAGFSLTIGCSKDETEPISEEGTEVPAESALPSVGGTLVKDTTRSAQFTSLISSDGGHPILERGFCWNTEPNPTISNFFVKVDADEEFTAHARQLQPGTKYYVRAYAKNLKGTGYGLQGTFTTLSEQVQDEIKLQIASLTMTSAEAQIAITTSRGPDTYERGVCWSTNPNPTMNDTKRDGGRGAPNFSVFIDKLNPGVTYYARAYMATVFQTFYSEPVTFTTTVELPVISTAEITPILSKSAVSGGTITSPNGQITERGICWSLTTLPTTKDFRTTHGPGSEAFESKMTNLGPEHTYYVRAYATNKAGTSYGPQRTFRTIATVKDFDGNVYETVVIGKQTWMAENLKTATYNNGDYISTTSNPNDYIWVFPLYQWPYDGKKENVDTYGRLYTWNVVKDSRQIAPVGWRIPSDEDWLELSGTLAKTYNILPIALAEPRLWKHQAAAYKNYSGFSALPGGMRNEDTFYGLETTAAWWSASVGPISSGDKMVSYWYLAGAEFKNFQRNERAAMSVRCIKN
ncbi:MAG: hypothetical protein EOO89_15890 [Pedobacter sp.]|nr:MAG: hypothetical protein EOO89_15890 [Pedobacter sp.]